MKRDYIKILLNDICVELSEEFDRNFERKAFFERKWKPRRNEGKGSLMLQTGKLRRSLRGRVTGNNSVTWTSSEPYADIHNRGGEITVTENMRRFFWAKYYELGGKIKYKKKGGMSKASIRVSKEAEFYRALALKKVGSKITIPQRQFIGDHPRVKECVKECADALIKEFLSDVRKGFK